MLSILIPAYNYNVHPLVQETTGAGAAGRYFF
jgi:hypothetical protein